MDHFNEISEFWDAAIEPLSSEDLDELAAIARISTEQRAEFDPMLQFCFFCAQDRNPYILKDETIAEYDARMFLRKMAEGYHRQHFSQQSQMRDLGITPEMIVAVKAELKHRQKRKGRPRTISSLESFLRNLFVMISKHRGSLRLDRKNQSGSLVTFLDRAKKHLPEGFIPNVLPFRLMETLKSEWAPKRSPFPIKCRLVDVGSKYLLSSTDCKSLEPGLPEQSSLDQPACEQIGDADCIKPLPNK